MYRTNKVRNAVVNRDWVVLQLENPTGMIYIVARGAPDTYFVARMLDADDFDRQDPNRTKVDLGVLQTRGCFV